MDKLNLKIISAKKVVLEKNIDSITAPAVDGQITILPHHANLLTLLKEGIMKLRYDSNEEYYAIGGGYLQTDGEEVIVLVSRAYGQDEINEKIVNEVKGKAKKLLETARDEKERKEALSLLRRSTIEDQLLKKVKKRKSI
jgi:F-type H+-transporting ATPase subunit epsilon